MEADFSVELGAEDETLEFPWASVGDVRYFDLKHNPELLSSIDEARGLKALREFLAAINSAASLFETAKCDAWFTVELNPQEDIFGAACKFGSYVDLLFADERRFSFPAHEQAVESWTSRLRKAPEIPAAAEFIVRRCDFKDEPRDGFYITLYSFGYANDENSARTQWASGLKLAEHAILGV